jgi:uncharacterized protein YciI
MFILMVNYLRSLEEIDELLPAHRQYLERHYHEGTFLLSGRQVPRTGGVILAIGDDRDAIRKIVHTDPFVLAGVARYDITQITPTAVSGALTTALTAEGPQPITTIQPVP